jgi:hypothetical protein
MIRATVFAAAAMPAYAQDVADWGGTGCQIFAVMDKPHIAEVHCHNALTSGLSVTEGLIEVGGVAVALVVFHEPGDIPDRFMLFPLDGRIAIPEVMEIGEMEGAVALIYEWAGM